jgi:hypothetical protein
LSHDHIQLRIVHCHTLPLLGLFSNVNSEFRFTAFNIIVAITLTTY